MSPRGARAALSIDLDDRWTYLQARGGAGDAADPGFLPLAVERALRLFAGLGARATFLVVGRDARRPELRDALAAVVEAGHEIGNHSLDHLPWLTLLAEDEQRDQIARAEAAIEAAAGVRPRGFRGPGHAASPTLRRHLAARSYLYDASPLPTFLMPIARRVYLRGLPLDGAQRRQRRHLGGGFAAGFAANRPRRLAAGGGTLVEIPVTTLPLLRLPIHFTWLQLMATRSERLARAYWSVARAGLRTAHNPPALLLHATDLLGADDAVGLDFFPAMDAPAARKLERVERALTAAARDWELGTLAAMADALRSPEAA